MSEHTVKLTDEQIRILLSVTGPRIATDPDNRYGDWSVDLDRRLREATEGAALNLGLTDQEAHDVHHALSTTVDLVDKVGEIPPHAPLYGARPRLVKVARRLDHERRHRGAVPNPNGPEEAQ